MKKRLILTSVLVLVLVLALFAFTACNTADTEYDAELVTNGDFEEYTSDSSSNFQTFDGWSVKSDWASVSTYGKQTLSTSEKNDSTLSSQLDENYLYLTNSSASYAYLYQQIKVDRKEIYKVTVDVRLKNLTKGSSSEYRGAYVSFLENTDYYFVEQKETTTDNGGWKTLTFYVRPVDSDYLTICLCLGAQNGTSSGTVYYDNVSMMKVEEAASGATVYDFKKSTIVRYDNNVGGILFVVFLALFTVAILIAAYVLIRRLYSRPTAFLNFSEVNGGVSKAGASSGRGSSVYSSPWFIASMLALGTFLINLIFLLSMYGFGGDMNYTVNLALLMGKSGAIRTAYATYSSALTSTSPGVLYILAIIGAMGKNLDYESVSILLRMVNVLAVMATVVMIYLYGRKYIGDRQSTIFAALYALLPATFIMSGLENTFTTLLICLITASVLLAVEKKYLPSYLIITLAVLLDVRALAVAPIIVAYFGYHYYKDDENLKKFTRNRAAIVFGFIGCFVLLYVLTLPVSIDYIAAESSQPFYGFKLIANEITNNSVFVDNALGLYGMVAMNEKTSSQTASILNLIFILVLEAYVLSLYFKFRNKQELIMLASFTLAMVATFTLKVDYTYIFLSLALGFIYTMVSGEKRMYGVLAGYSTLAFLNIGQIMNNSSFVHGTSFFTASTTETYMVNFETTSPEYIVFCVFTVLVSLYYAYVTYSISNNAKLVDIPAMSKPFPETFKQGCKNFGSDVKDFFSHK